MLSKVFPAYHPRAGEPTGFREKFLSGEKIHTIRANEKSHFKDGDVISVREWSGKPYRSKQVVIRDGVKIGVEPVALDHDDNIADFMEPVAAPFKTIAKNDGLREVDFVDWFFPPSSKHDFTGDIIHFTDFRYAANPSDRSKNSERNQ
jgi:hypothetical protein